MGQVPQVTTKIGWADRLGAVRMRLDIRRMHHAVTPGLYAVGHPAPDSPVLVSANYKLSFDRLRQELDGLDAWILVLDTKGINVWCAAGKGTFGTEEIVHRVETARLGEVVSHRTLVLPQLAAPGVAAHEVKTRSGFRVLYGPVRAQDIPAFLDAGMQATPEMRRVRFNLLDRLVLVPLELVQWGRYALLLMAGMFLLGGLNRAGYDSALALIDGSKAGLLVLLAFLGVGILTPVLLPWLPGRSFSVKGAEIGVILVCSFVLLGWIGADGAGEKLELTAWSLMMPGIGAFMAMNFTGASTFTSLSGVKREMRYAVPLQVAAGVTGLALWIAARFIG